MGRTFFSLSLEDMDRENFSLQSKGQKQVFYFSLWQHMYLVLQKSLKVTMELLVSFPHV